MAGLDPTALTKNNDEYDVLEAYVPAFVQHLQDTRARLGIGLGSQVSRNRNAPDTQGSDWTPAEHDAFFRALSVFSRWRPDLIAACVPTKSEWEVWRYLGALEAGAAELAVQQDEDDADVAMGVDGDSDACSDVGSGVNTDEDACEPAVEVSQSWIDVEEQVASLILEEERCGAAADAEGAWPKRRRGRLRDSGRGHRRRRAVSNEEGEGSPLSAREGSQEASDSEQKRKALMGGLELPHLLVLDSILREGEAANKESRESSVTTTRTEHGDEGEPNVRDVEEPSTSTQIIAPLGTSDVSSAMIDPMLLALSGDANPMGHSDGSTYVPTQDLPSSEHLPPPEALLQPGATTMFTSPSGDTLCPHSDVAANAGPDLSLFSPQSRRRIQKRLYMRRKRANSGGVVDTGIEKLRPGPGKKHKSGRIQTPVVSTTPPSDVEEEATENVRKKNKGGVGLSYKLKAQFAELGVDWAYLRNQGIDLLNLGALGRLMGSSSEEDVVQSVDAELICFLQAAMVLFVTDITHRAIVWREKEIRLKQRSQGWRQGNHITVAAVEHAVFATGARYHSLKEYFESPKHTKVPSVDGDGEAADLSSELPQLSPHRDVYTPLIRPPPEWRIGALSCLARTYEREATRTRCGSSAEVEDELMSDETDEEALAVELAEDAAVDEGDMVLSAAAEAELFEGVKGK